MLLNTNDWITFRTTVCKTFTRGFDSPPRLHPRFAQNPIFTAVFDRVARSGRVQRFTRQSSVFASQPDQNRTKVGQKLAMGER